MYKNQRREEKRREVNTYGGNEECWRKGGEEGREGRREREGRERGAKGRRGRT